VAKPPKSRPEPEPNPEPEPPAVVEVAAAELVEEPSVDPLALEVIDGPAEPEQAPSTAESAETDDLEKRCPLDRDIEMKAMVGQLSTDSIECLEDRLKTSVHQTTRDKVSRLIIANAFGSGDMSQWERRVAQHLKEVSQADPDMCYKYASHLFKRSPGRHAEVIYWSNRAMENRHAWKGDSYVSRVYALHKMRSNASLKAWEMAGQHFAASPSTAAQQAEEIARIETKTYAREWIDYSSEAGRDSTPAVHLCISASGDKEFCADN